MKAVYQSVLGESRAALVRLEPDLRYRARCGGCGGPARSVHSKARKFVRDLDFGDCRVQLQIEHRKVYCDACRGVRVERLDFVDTSQRVTHRLGAYAAELCRLGLPVVRVADHLGLDPKTVKHFEKTVLNAKFGATDYTGLKHLAIDEIAVKKGHSYMTIVLDYDTGRVVWAGVGRQITTLDGFFENMPEESRLGIEAVAVDMWEAYIQSVKKWCPGADIVFDLFHVVKAFGKVIDQIRNEEYRKADAAGKAVLKGSKYLLLRRHENLKADQRGRLKEVLTLNERLSTLYYLKDFLVHLWSYRIPGWAEGALAEWCTLAREDGHPALVRFAEMLERYSYGIINHCKHRIHTSKLEGVNNKIKVIKRTAYGFHDLDYFGLKIKQAFPGRESCN
jgi:transposase